MLPNCTAFIFGSVHCLLLVTMLSLRALGDDSDPGRVMESSTLQTFGEENYPVLLQLWDFHVLISTVFFIFVEIK